MLLDRGKKNCMDKDIDKNKDGIVVMRQLVDGLKMTVNMC